MFLDFPSINRISRIKVFAQKMSLPAYPSELCICFVFILVFMGISTTILISLKLTSNTPKHKTQRYFWPIPGPNFVRVWRCSNYFISHRGTHRQKLATTKEWGICPLTAGRCQLPSCSSVPSLPALLSHRPPPRPPPPPPMPTGAFSPSSLLHCSSTPLHSYSDSQPRPA